MGNRSRETLLTPGTSQSSTCGLAKATGKEHKQSGPVGENLKKPYHLRSQFHLSWRKCRNSQQGGFKWANTHPQTWKTSSTAEIWTGCFSCWLWSFLTVQQMHQMLSTSTPLEPLRCVLEWSSQAYFPPGCWRSYQFVWFLTGFPAQPQGAAAPPLCHHQRAQRAQGKQSSRLPGLLMVRGCKDRGGRLSSTRWNISLLSLSAEHFTIDLPE